MQILICCPTSYEKSYQLFYTNTKICVFTLSVLAFLICLPYQLSKEPKYKKISSKFQGVLSWIWASWSVPKVCEVNEFKMLEADK